jgi:hypothetical protein
VTPFIGEAQHHNPFVQGFTVGPTPKPLDRFRSILLSKYDFPVRYIPATDITPIGPGIERIKLTAYSSNTYSKLI